MIQFKDIRDQVARNPIKSFRTRELSRVVGITIHHTAGGDDPFATARYHVGPNHVSDTGCPSINYTFFIDKQGTLYLCNDLEARTWSIGGPPPFPIEGKKNASSNYHFLSVVVGGSFDSQWNPTGEEPTPEQICSLMLLVSTLTRSESMTSCPFQCSAEDEAVFRGYVYGALSHLSSADLYGHFDFGKPSCPARTLEGVIRAIRSNGSPVSKGGKIQTTRDWQASLKKLGLYEGTVDGLWGPQSRKGLIAFERSVGLKPQGVRSAKVQALLEAHS